MEHITLSGHSDVFPLSTGAKRRLLDYLQRARPASAHDLDGDESVRDLETAIGDRLRTALDDGATSVDDDTMTRILNEIGPLQPTTPPPAGKAPTLARIQQGKWFGGLVLGITVRSDLRLDWTRTIALGLLVISGGVLGLAYLAALPFVPRIETAEEYRAMIARDRS